MRHKRPDDNPNPTNTFPDATGVAEIDTSSLQPGWDRGCQIGNSQANRGTALFMEPADTALVIPWFMDSYSNDGPILF